MFILLIVMSFVASSLVRNWMKRTYGKWSQIPNQAGVNGHAVARHILDTNGLTNVKLEVSEGLLTDHYIPSKKLIRLSNDINDQPTVASVAVAAHECGHALQDKEGYRYLKLKALLMPAAAIGNQLGLALSLGGGFFGNMMLMNLGLSMMLLGMIMPLLTLPIEFDASKRALSELERLQLVDEKEYQGAKSMLTAAAFTYVAGAASSMAIVALIMFRFLRR